MSSTPANPRTFAANTSLGLRVTPSNSPFPRTPKSPSKARGLYESGLSLRRIIGTTVSSPNAFDCLTSSRIFAYTAGAAAVVVSVDGSSQNIQRFFRARPTAVPLNASSANSFAPSTPVNTANDSKNRAVARDSVLPYSLSSPYTSLEWGESSSSRTWTSRERIKAATCLSMSRDGRFLAVGETGYSPRVLIFSLNDNSSDVPLVILNEHTYGVRAVAFSQDQKYLASLGSPNDGFLYVWSINQRTGSAKLQSSNKCTSFVRQMIWLGQNIITVGTRHVKIWKVEDNRPASPSKPKYGLDGTPLPAPVQPSLKTLAGRNVLLGALVDATFTAITAVSDHNAIVCSEKGDVCLLDDRDGNKLLKLTSTGFPITCVAISTLTQQVRIGGRNGIFRLIGLDDLLSPNTPPVSPIPPNNVVPPDDAGHFCAMGYLSGTLVTIDSKHSITMSNSNADDSAPKLETKPFTAHGDAVLGVILLKPNNEMNAAFLTWSANGTVVFWDLDGTNKATVKVEVEQISLGDEDPINQCQIVRASRLATFLVAGDRYGVLRVINPATELCVFETRAHLSDIQDIALFEDDKSILLASCSRDRTVQLFRLLQDQSLFLIQTLDDHSASVTSLLFVENGETLISCSTDRTVHIRQLVTKKDADEQDVMGAISVRIITLKASPVSMTPGIGDQMGIFMVSLLDRTVSTYDIATGRLCNSFRVTDNEGSEAVVLDALVMGTPSSLPGRPNILAGISSTDKSIRVYDGTSGGFLDREWGHTAAVTDVAMMEIPDSDQKVLISTGSDGTIMIWDLLARTADSQDAVDRSSSDRDSSPPKETTSAKPPLRRVLSRADLAEFHRASPVSTPTGRSSPPRTLRKKTSRYGLSTQSPTLAPPLPTSSKQFSSNCDETPHRRQTVRTRSRSPPPSPKRKDMRRPSLASLDSRGRTKSSGTFSEFGSLNMSTEQACRTLRAYRKKLLSSETVREEVIKELDQELRLTAMALGEKSAKSKAISDTVLTGLLDQYSSRLVSMFDEKLRLTKGEPGIGALVDIQQRPKTADNEATSLVEAP